ncbi:hypothetical protein NPIL_311271 [Nephila pilipes]|uniref:Uncharacterized protein n=1 Tax=Nephila pilipes TaxID=299642 RepID=A0A8X6NQX8_NEPPI|nr:hypothetical protein NPIL_311271 [Nephila pilipes]
MLSFYLISFDTEHGRLAPKTPLTWKTFREEAEKLCAGTHHASIVFCPTPIPENGGFRLTHYTRVSVHANNNKKKMENMKGAPYKPQKGNKYSGK